MRAIPNPATNDSLINCHTVMRFKLSCLYRNVRRVSSDRNALAVPGSWPVRIEWVVEWYTFVCWTMVENRIQSGKTFIIFRRNTWEMNSRVKELQSETPPCCMSTNRISSIHAHSKAFIFLYSFCALRKGFFFYRHFYFNTLKYRSSLVRLSVYLMY